MLFSLALAAEVQLTVDTDTLARGQRVSAAVIVTGGVPAAVPSLASSPGLGVQFVGQTSTTSIINGRAERYLKFDYQVFAQDEGRFTLGPAEVEGRSGEHWRSKTVEITVQAAAPPTATSQALATAEATFSAVDAWQGQVLLFHQEIRSRGEIVGMQWHNVPSTGLLAPRDGRPERNSYVLQDPAGALYVDETLTPFMLTSAGTLTFNGPVAELDVVTATRGRRGLLGGLMRETERVVVPTPDLRVAVRPLPAAPAGYTGLVGDFALQVRASATSARVGDSIGWTLDLSGDGALDGLKLPPLPEIPGARLYDGNQSPRAALRKGTYRAFLTVERVVVPTREGTLELPAVELVTFSPTAGAYVTLRADAQRVQVAPGDGPGEVGLTTFTPDGVPAVVAPADDGPRGPWAHGPADRIDLRPVMPWLLTLAAAPGALVLAGTAHSWLRRPPAEVRHRPSDHLRDLPADPAARLAALDRALREVAAARPTDPEAQALRHALDQARFAERPVAPDLEARVRAFVITHEEAA